MIELKLTIEEVNTILSGLYDLPYKLSAELIINIKKQADPQVEKINTFKN